MISKFDGGMFYFFFLFGYPTSARFMMIHDDRTSARATVLTFCRTSSPHRETLITLCTGQGFLFCFIIAYSTITDMYIAATNPDGLPQSRQVEVSRSLSAQKKIKEIQGNPGGSRMWLHEVSPGMFTRLRRDPVFSN